MGMLRLERLKQAQGELFFRGIRGMGRWFGRPLSFGDPLFLEGFFLLIPRTELRSRLIDDKAHGKRIFGGHQEKKDEALSPHLATTGFIPQFIEMGQGLSGCGARMVGIVDNQGARWDAVVPPNDPHTGHQQLGPGELAVAKHPCRGCQRIGAEAGACKARPANGVGHQHGGDTKREPGPLYGRHTVARILRAHRLVNSLDKGTHKGSRLSNHHSGPHG